MLDCWSVTFLLVFRGVTFSDIHVPNVHVPTSTQTPPGEGALAAASVGANPHDRKPNLPVCVFFEGRGVFHHQFLVKMPWDFMNG